MLKTLLLLGGSIMFSEVSATKKAEWILEEKIPALVLT
jgi:hypothetical protein